MIDGEDVLTIGSRYTGLGSPPETSRQPSTESNTTMTIQISPDGFFTALWAVNKQGQQVFPFLQGKRGTTARGFDITLTGKKEDYHLADLDRLLQHIADGDFNAVGRVRMKPRSGGNSNGFAIRHATMNEALAAEIARRGHR